MSAKIDTSDSDSSVALVEPCECSQRPYFPGGCCVCICHGGPVDITDVGCGTTRPRTTDYRAEWYPEF